jgi:hypothetical protein
MSYFLLTHNTVRYRALDFTKRLGDRLLQPHRPGRCPRCCEGYVGELSAQNEYTSALFCSSFW